MTGKNIFRKRLLVIFSGKCNILYPDTLFLVQLKSVKETALLVYVLQKAVTLDTICKHQVYILYASFFYFVLYKHYLRSFKQQSASGNISNGSAIKQLFWRNSIRKDMFAMSPFFRGEIIHIIIYAVWKIKIGIKLVCFVSSLNNFVVTFYVHVWWMF